MITKSEYLKNLLRKEDFRMVDINLSILPSEHRFTMLRKEVKILYPEYRVFNYDGFPAITKQKKVSDDVTRYSVILKKRAISS